MRALTWFPTTQKNGKHPQFQRTAKQAPKETYIECVKISELQKCVLKQKQAEIMLQIIPLLAGPVPFFGVTGMRMRRKGSWQ